MVRTGNAPSEATLGWYCLPNFQVYRRSTPGKTWTRHAIERGPCFLYLQFTDAKLGHVLIRGSKDQKNTAVHCTADAGKTRTSLGELAAADAVHCNSFPAANHGWVVGDQGYMAHFAA